MIIDCILDRRDGSLYSPDDFYRNVFAYGEVGEDITKAMDFGTEQDVKSAICEYIIRNEYDPDICGYVWSNRWL